ncbi:hypothetical protein [Brevundimonas sp. SORGH_AS_0993]|uniref:hypothetical protein n=1 Tax=Brevundimonas sp. SORGH_AS_0993 TaxID=3041794 RepID=UPI0027807E25|nr:hypothetical protein [Brevundimonas sp. SORGH_AS_0993]MDQ1153178.1 hypothetical protein [Brevundimonas sp. SORGH_AS_0993]
MSIQDEYTKAKASADSKAAAQRSVFESRCSELAALGAGLAAETAFLAQSGWTFQEEQQGFRLENKIAYISPICFAPDGSYVVHHAYHSSKWSGKAPNVSSLQDVKRAVAELMVEYGK